MCSQISNNSKKEGGGGGVVVLLLRADPIRKTSGDLLFGKQGNTYLSVVCVYTGAGLIGRTSKLTVLTCTSLRFYFI